RNASALGDESAHGALGARVSHVDITSQPLRAVRDLAIFAGSLGGFSSTHSLRGQGTLKSPESIREPGKAMLLSSSPPLTQGRSTVPLDRAPEPLLERRLGDEAKARGRARRVEHPSRLAIGLRGVPDDMALEARQLRDQADQVLDRDLLSRAHVDR